ncbi:sensor histidine kinase [Labilibacter marinus]|uniref:sensor histidine kinase n=1 Tax=Labilibacter marinus TaxID=1477105 RepID=UPI00082B829F|nr:HAMP domain-containing sensor histidine kinase [Labilibacter marinus]
MRYHSFLSSEDAAWGEKQVIRFRWILIAAILVLIGYIFLSGETERALISLSIAGVYIFYNSVLNLLLRKFNGASWIRYASSTFDVTFLSLHIFNYSYFFSPIAVSTAASVFIYALLIMLSVLRYDGKLVIFTTAYVILCYNVVYFVRYPQIDPELIPQVASSGPEGVIYKSVYFILMGFFMFSIPKMINRLVEKQNAVNNERREIEIKLALETQRKEIAMQNLMLEQELSKQLNEQKEVILKQNQDLEKLVATKDKLFSIIGHDLRSPFCIQSSLSEYLLVDFENVEKKILYENINAIHKTANSGLDMLANLMDWSMSQNSAFNPKPVDVNIKEFVEKVVDQQSEAWGVKDITINKNISDCVCAHIDEKMFESILRNLLSNAIKFTPTNGEVSIKANNENQKCIIEVVDSGVGMSKTQLDSLFSVNNTISSLGTNNEKGTGLGLVLCKEMVDKNNGIIQVKSILGEGTQFEIALPQRASYN